MYLKLKFNNLLTCILVGHLYVVKTIGHCIQSQFFKETYHHYDVMTEKNQLKW